MDQFSALKSSRVSTLKNSDFSALERRGYGFGKKLGKGSYGNVIASNYRESNRKSLVELACKCVDKAKAPKDFLEKFFPREIQILTQISHPNIIAIHSILQSGSTVFIFMRWAENGDLLDYVKNNGAVRESQACLWFYQMVSAVKYLHSKNYAHRDLKCENILISKHMNIKLADFGFARSCVDDNNEKILSQTFCGSAGENTSSLQLPQVVFLTTFCPNFITAYAAPEIVSGNSYDPMKSDVWSLGVILFIILNAIMPFDDSNMGKLIRDQKERGYRIQEEIVGKLSRDCKSLLHALLEPIPRLRLGINKVYEMKWLQKHVEKNSS